MNKVEIGREFEKQAVEILNEEKFKIKEKSSSENWLSPYDFLIEKEGKEYALEVRGRKNGKNKNLFSIQKKKLNYLRNLNKEVLFLCINDAGYMFFNIKEIKDFSKPIKIGEKTIYVICGGEEYFPSKNRRMSQPTVTIRLSRETKDLLDKNKIHPREIYDKVINRIFKELNQEKKNNGTKTPNTH